MNHESPEKPTPAPIADYTEAAKKVLRLPKIAACMGYGNASWSEWTDIDIRSLWAIANSYLAQHPPNSHDWIEHLADEDNGNYQHICEECGIQYQAHKRHVGTCKKCWFEFAEKEIPNLRGRVASLEQRLAEAEKIIDYVVEYRWDVIQKGASVRVLSEAYRNKYPKDVSAIKGEAA